MAQQQGCLREDLLISILRRPRILRRVEAPTRHLCLTFPWAKVRNRGDAYADRSPLDFGDVGHAEIVRNMDFS